MATQRYRYTPAALLKKKLISLLQIHILRTVLELKTYGPLHIAENILLQKMMKLIISLSNCKKYLWKYLILRDFIVI